MNVKERAELRLQQAVGQDPFTGIASRRRFDEALDAALRAERSGRPLSLIMIDEDALKTCNDPRGHDEGDVPPRTIASVLTVSTAGIDGLAPRYGGEEFVVVLSKTDRVGAVQFAKPCVEAYAIETSRIPARNMGGSLSVSGAPPPI